MCRKQDLNSTVILTNYSLCDIIYLQKYNMKGRFQQ